MRKKTIKITTFNRNRGPKLVSLEHFYDLVESSLYTTVEAATRKQIRDSILEYCWYSTLEPFGLLESAVSDVLRAAE